MNSWPDLRPILHVIPWTVVGGVATRAYMPERVTKDLEMLVRAVDGDAVRQQLEAAGCRYLSSLPMPGFVMQSWEGEEIDVILGEYPWLDEALANPRKDPAGYPVRFTLSSVNEADCFTGPRCGRSHPNAWSFLRRRAGARTSCCSPLCSRRVRRPGVADLSGPGRNGQEGERIGD